MRWVVIPLSLLALGAALGDLPIRERTTTAIELDFTDLAGSANLPASLVIRLDEPESGLELLDDVAIDPSAQPCQTPATGCTRITLPADALRIVGICKGTLRTPCRTAADCPESVACRGRTKAFQTLALTTAWTGSGYEGRDEIVLRVLNLPFVE